MATATNSKIHVLAANQTDERCNIWVSAEVRDTLKALFPDLTLGEGVAIALETHRNTSPHPFAVESTELGVKLDRLEEVLSTVALTNVELAQHLRRYEAGRFRAIRGMLSLLAKEYEAMSELRVALEAQLHEGAR